VRTGHPLLGRAEPASIIVPLADPSEKDGRPLVPRTVLGGHLSDRIASSICATLLWGDGVSSVPQCSGAALGRVVGFRDSELEKGEGRPRRPGDPRRGRSCQLVGRFIARGSGMSLDPREEGDPEALPLRLKNDLIDAQSHALARTGPMCCENKFSSGDACYDFRIYWYSSAIHNQRLIG